MKRITLFIISLFLVLSLALSLAACASVNQDDSGQTVNINCLSLTLERAQELIYQPEKIHIYINRFHTYIPSSTEESLKLATLLSVIDFTIFEKIEKNKIDDEMLSPLELIIEKDGKSYLLSLLYGDVNDYLVFSNFKPLTSRAEALEETLRPKGEDEEIVLRAPSGSIGDPKKYNDIFDSIRLDISDPENCAEIKILTDINPEYANFPSPGASYRITKWRTAQLMAILNGSNMSDLITATPINAADFDLEIIVNDKTYLYDIETGTYTLDDGNTFVLEEQWQKTLWVYLH